MTSKDVAACPFCSSRACVYVLSSTDMRSEDCECCAGQDESFTVCCANNAGGCGACGGYRLSRQAAIEVWNQRSAPETPERKVYWVKGYWSRREDVSSFEGPPVAVYLVDDQAPEKTRGVLCLTPKAELDELASKLEIALSTDCKSAEFTRDFMERMEIALQDFRNVLRQVDNSGASMQVGGRAEYAHVGGPFPNQYDNESTEKAPVAQSKSQQKRFAAQTNRAPCTPDTHMYTCVADAPIGEGVCVFCGAKEPAEEESPDQTRAPLPPDVLADALQDVVHKDEGESRAATAVRTPRPRSGDV